ncbi:MAG: HAMP domain-containing protein [Elusimicrobia bacterium]|nr:HAMP domain-containing protein [Elusimicrobiota bacterium]
MIRTGIYFRFIAAMTALALVPLLFLGASLLNISERGMQAAVLELHTKLAEKLAQGLQVYFRTIDDGIRFTIGAVQHSNLKWPEKQDLLRAFIESHPDIEELSVVDKKGAEVLKVYNPSLLDKPALMSRAEDAGYREFSRAKDRTVRITPRPGQAPRLEIYYPLNAALSLRVSLLLKSLWESVGAERVGGTGYAIVVDKEGRPILYPPDRMRPELIKLLPERPIVQQALRAVSIGSMEFMNDKGELLVSAYAPVPDLGGAVIIQQPKAEAYLAATKMKRTAVIVIVFFLCAAVLIAFFMARRLTQPLLVVTQAADEVAKGTFPGEIKIETGDEIQVLADTFNRMVAQLRKYAELQVDRVLREQQKTEAILFSIVDGIIMTDNDGQVQLVNRRAREILNCGPEDSLEGRRLEEVIGVPELKSAILHLAANPGTGVLKEADLSTEQYRRFIRVSAQSVTLPGKGTKIGVVTALRDVTAEKQLDKMKEEFLHSITHDLRNPIGSIIGFSEFLVKGVVGVLNEQQAGMVGSIQKSASRLLAMVNNILDAAKMEAGKLDVKLKSTSLAGVAGHAIDILGALAQRRGITMELQAEEEFTIHVDGDLVERVFANLIGNAIKFAAENGRITVSISDDGDSLKGSVKDDGPGIPPAYVDKIFEKFEQIPGQRQGGTGLGLTICRHIVEAHLGRIWVESELGKGASFCFTLPKDLGYDESGRVIRKPKVPSEA